METRSRIPTVVFAYHDLGMVRETLASLARLGNRLAITVVENGSVNTATHLRPYFVSLLRRGTIDRYILFRNNITNNALEVVYDDRLIYFERSMHVLITDGDIVPDRLDWLDEELGVLDRHRDVFVCGVQLTTENLPLATFPEAWRWIGPQIAVHDDYIESPQSGLHLCLFRTPDFRAYLRHRRRTGQRFVDGSIGAYIGATGRKWAWTRRATARHLVWDLYADLDHPYTRIKLARSFDQTWNHYGYSTCDVWTRDAHHVHVPIMPLARVPYAILRRWAGAMSARVRARHG